METELHQFHGNEIESSRSSIHWKKWDLGTDIYKRNVKAQWNIWHMICCKIVGVALASKILHLLSPQKEKKVLHLVTQAIYSHPMWWTHFCHTFFFSCASAIQYNCTRFSETQREQRQKFDNMMKSSPPQKKKIESCWRERDRPAGPSCSAPGLSWAPGDTAPQRSARAPMDLTGRSAP